MPSNSALSPTPTRRPRRKGELTAARILDAAEQLFAERGYAGTTLRDVAERVGIRIPSLYNHFPGKESLYAAVLERDFAPVVSLLSRIVEAGPAARRDSSPVVARIMEILSLRPSLPRLILHETLSGGQRLTPMLRDWIAPTFARAHQAMEARGAAERWRPEQIPLLVLAMYHVAVGYFTIAPLYEELAGRDLLSEDAIDAQTRFLSELIDTLLTGEDEI